MTVIDVIVTVVVATMTVIDAIMIVVVESMTVIDATTTVVAGAATNLKNVGGKDKVLVAGVEAIRVKPRVFLPFRLKVLKVNY